MTLANITSQYRFNLFSVAFEDTFSKNEKILDIGCGNGIITNLIAKKFKVKVYGCDIDKYSLYDFPFKKLKENGKLPFNSDSFDTTILNDVLHHTELKIQEELLKESLRVAKKILVFEDEPTFLGSLFDYILNKIHHPSMKIPLTFRKTGEWQAIFKRLNIGYKTIEVKRPFFYPFSHVAFCLRGT